MKNDTPAIKNQMVFKRHEVKFMLTEEQYQKVRVAMKDHMRADKHGRTTNYSLYYDTPDFLLARRSAEKPVYKEKLRIRSYGTAKGTDDVFIELKKKYKGITYKRRITMPAQEAAVYLSNGICVHPSQITHEIDYFRNMYPGLAPRILISYDREAFYDRENHDFRITFDRNIKWRDTDLDLHTGDYGQPLLEEGQVLMEVKTAEAIPIWLVSVLDENKAYKTHFSKYGNACRAYFQEKTKKGMTACLNQSLAEYLTQKEAN